MNYPRVKKDSNKHGGDIVAKVFKSHNIKHIFTLVGGHISPILVSSKNEGIKVVDVRNEANAVFAADAYGRLSDTPGIAVVTAGPGVTNSVTALKNALMSDSPLILIGGAAATLLKGRGSLQDIDQISLMKSVCKYVLVCNLVKDINPILKKAFQLAMSYPRGPVFVEMPIDILYPYRTVIKEAIGKPKKNFLSQLIDKYLKLRVDIIFDRAFENNNYDPLPSKKLPLIKNSKIKKSINILQKCKKPILVIGSQIIDDKSEISNCINYLNKLNIPCYLTGMARGFLGNKNKLQYIHNRTNSLREADIIILIGVSCDFRMGYGKKMNKSAKIISINHNKNSLNLNHGIFWNANIKINGFIPDFLSKISNNFSFENESWINILDDRENSREKEIESMLLIKYNNLINPIYLIKKLKERLEDNSILIADGGDFIGTAAYLLKPKLLGWLDPGPFGTLGVGGGFALAAKLVFPEKNVWILYGDGACGFSLIEFDTFMRHKLDINCLIGNDACWSQIEREQIPMFNDDVACKLDFSNYHKIIKEIDNRVTDEIISNDSDIDKIKLNYPIAINALIAKTDFRKGSISV